MANEVETKEKGFMEKYWWVCLSAGLLVANLQFKSMISDGIQDGCLKGGGGTICTCVANETTKRLGPVYLLHPLMTESTDVEKIGEAAFRYCGAGG